MCYGGSPRVATTDPGYNPGTEDNNYTPDPVNNGAPATVPAATKLGINTIVAPLPDPLAIFGARIPVDSVSNVGPGQMGKRRGANDLKLPV